MIRLSDREFSAAISSLDRLDAAARPFDAPPPDNFGPLVEGVGAVVGGVAVAILSTLLSLSVATVTFDPADEARIEREVLDDGRVELTLRPNSDDGVELSLSTDCPITARELAAALINAGSSLAVRLAQVAAMGSDLADMDPAGAA